MFSSYKNKYFKYKAKSILQDRLINAMNEERRCLDRLSEWKNKVYKSSCMGEEKFNVQKASQIKWSHEMYREAKIKVDTIKTIIDDMKNL